MLLAPPHPFDYVTDSLRQGRVHWLLAVGCGITATMDTAINSAFSRGFGIASRHDLASCDQPNPTRVRRIEQCD